MTPLIGFPGALAIMAFLAVSLVWRPAVACPAPFPFFATESQLPATRLAVARRHLPILILGGAAAASVAAGGQAYTYPERIAARLRERLPGVTVTISVRTVTRKSTADLLTTLDADLADSKATLVIWGPGGSAAARGEDVDAFAGTILDVLARTRSARADMVLMSLQYAPSVARILNLSPYRMALVGTAEVEGVPVIDRYEYMRFWHTTGLVNLDAIDPAERVVVARKVFDCIAEAIVDGIADAVR